MKNYHIYKHIDYREINLIEYKNDYLINNWGFSLIIGIVISIITFIWSIKSILSFDIQSISSASIRGYISIKIVPFLLFIISSILIYQSLRKSMIISIKIDNKKHKVALKEFEETNNTDSLINFLSERTTLKRL